MDKGRDRWIDRLINKQLDKWIYIQIDREKGGQVDGQKIDTQIYIFIGRQ